MVFKRLAVDKTIKIFNITIRYAGQQEVINDDQICICQLPKELNILSSGLRDAESFEQLRHCKITDRILVFTCIIAKCARKERFALM